MLILLLVASLQPPLAGGNESIGQFEAGRYGGFTAGKHMKNGNDARLDEWLVQWPPKRHP